jgi:hypothetical protein
MHGAGQRVCLRRNTPPRRSACAAPACGVRTRGNGVGARGSSACQHAGVTLRGATRRVRREVARRRRGGAGFGGVSRTSNVSSRVRRACVRREVARERREVARERREVARERREVARERREVARRRVGARERREVARERREVARRRVGARERREVARRRVGARERREVARRRVGARERREVARRRVGARGPAASWWRRAVACVRACEHRAAHRHDSDRARGSSACVVKTWGKRERHSAGVRATTGARTCGDQRYGVEARVRLRRRGAAPCASQRVATRRRGRRGAMAWGA